MGLLMALSSPSPSYLFLATAAGLLLLTSVTLQDKAEGSFLQAFDTPVAVPKFWLPGMKERSYRPACGTGKPSKGGRERLGSHEKPNFIPFSNAIPEPLKLTTGDSEQGREEFKLRYARLLVELCGFTNDSKLQVYVVKEKQQQQKEKQASDKKKQARALALTTDEQATALLPDAFLLGVEFENSDRYHTEFKLFYDPNPRSFRIKRAIRNIFTFSKPPH